MISLDDLKRHLRPLKNRVSLMIYRAVVRVVNDAGKLQLHQVDGFADETLDGLERFGSYGLAAHPHPGAEAIVASVASTRSHGVVIAVEDRRYRLKNLQAGEVALYDDLGQVVHLTRDGIVIRSPKPVSIESDESIGFSAPEITLTANTVTVDADLFETSGDTHLGGSDIWPGSCCPTQPTATGCAVMPPSGASRPRPPRPPPGRSF